MLQVKLHGNQQGLYAPSVRDKYTLFHWRELKIRQVLHKLCVSSGPPVLAITP